MSTRSSAIRWPQTQRGDTAADQATDAGLCSTHRLAASRKLRSTWLYGDGTPFPHSGDFLEIARQAIACGVALLNAHVAIEQAAARRARLLDAARVASEVEWAEIDVSTVAELARVRALAGAGRTLAQRAIQAFMLRHDLPGTRRALRMIAQGGSYASRVAIATPFGVEAELDLGIPEHHAWREFRRFGDLIRPTGGLSADSGVHSKRAMIESEALDDLHVSAIDVGAHRIVLTLRERPCGGQGYKLDFDSSSARIRVGLTKIAEDGTERAEPPIALAGEDRTPLLRVWKGLVESTRDLPTYRRAILAMVIDGKAIQDGIAPRLVCERLVGVLAPTLNEIARRSSTPGALVLLRDDGAEPGDEVRVPCAELYEAIARLPVALRGMFDPLNLDRRSLGG
jgi:hypothetical protein